MKKFGILAGLFFLMHVHVESQERSWRNLVPLESVRSEVESILGKPEKYFGSFGSYETEVGQFSVWYSHGGCRKDVEGLQWNVSRDKMTKLVVYLEKARPLSFYVAEIKNYAKRESPGGYSRNQYLSVQNDVIYQTIARSDGSEFVEMIVLQPGKNKERLLCKDSKQLLRSRKK